jgi:hypothetical protein
VFEPASLGAGARCERNSKKNESPPFFTLANATVTLVNALQQMNFPTFPRHVSSTPFGSSAPR